MNRVAGQQAAWDTYLAVTKRVLPVLDDFAAADADAITNRSLGGVVIRIRRYAPMWGEHGPMLIASAASAVRLYRHGDIAGLRDLLHVIAHRLYQLSTGPAAPGKPRNQRQPGLPQAFPLPPFTRPPYLRPPFSGPPGNDTSDEGTKGVSEE